MKTYGTTALVVFMILFALSLGAAEKSEKPGTGPKVQEKTATSPGKGLFIQYKPPRLGKPGSRIGGGTRGTGTDTPLLSALAPAHPGLTSKPRPSLCWYIEKPMHTRIEITLNDEKAVKPVLEKKLASPLRGGVQCLKLSDYGITLQPDVEYQWFVAIIPDPEQRSRDIISGGLIIYREPAAALSEKLTSIKKTAVPALYAEEGIWYDAVSSLSDLIAANPDDRDLRLMRADLLEQAGLTGAAQQDRK
ncbi:MAG: DUF928 domain-containing protein [Nitrospirae bacterium]|nr:DUF928 domain-containing protein [Nitrospirota bacterium]